MKQKIFFKSVIFIFLVLLISFPFNVSSTTQGESDLTQLCLEKEPLLSHSDCAVKFLQISPELINFNDLPSELFSDKKFQNEIVENFEKYSKEVLGDKINLIKGNLKGGFIFSQDGKLTLSNEQEYNLDNIPRGSTVTVNQEKIVVELEEGAEMGTFSEIVPKGEYLDVVPKGDFYFGDTKNPFKLTKGNLIVNSNGDLFLSQESSLSYFDGKNTIEILNPQGELINLQSGSKSPSKNSISFLDNEVFARVSESSYYTIDFGNGQDVTLGGNGLSRTVTFHTPDFGDKNKIYRYTGEINGNYNSEIVKEIQTAVGAKSDGLYGPETKSKVSQFQKQYNGLGGDQLKEDGIWGPNTQAAWKEMHGDYSFIESSDIKDIHFFRNGYDETFLNFEGKENSIFLTTRGNFESVSSGGVGVSLDNLLTEKIKSPDVIVSKSSSISFEKDLENIQSKLSEVSPKYFGSNPQDKYYGLVDNTKISGIVMDEGEIVKATGEMSTYFPGKGGMEGGDISSTGPSLTIWSKTFNDVTLNGKPVIPVAISSRVAENDKMPLFELKNSEGEIIAYGIKVDNFGTAIDSNQQRLIDVPDSQMGRIGLVAGVYPITITKVGAFEKNQTPFLSYLNQTFNLLITPISFKPFASFIKLEIIIILWKKNSL